MDAPAFIERCAELGHKALQFEDGRLLIASMTPEHARHFDGCRQIEFSPEALSKPSLRRFEVLWRPPAEPVVEAADGRLS